MAGKYAPLREYLATREKSEVRLVLSFEAVGRHVMGGLPPSAASGEAWWTSTAARAQGKAWRDAGWLVESVDLSAGVVVFARLPVGVAADPTGPVAVVRPAAVEGGESIPAPAPEPGKQASWRSMRGDLVAGSLAAVSGGVAAVIALDHLPAYVIVLLSLCVAAIAFAATQAVTAREATGRALRWMYVATAFLVVAVGGAFLYHEQLDPATRPGLPFTVSVAVDGQNPVIPEECRQIVLPGPWRDPAPPAAVTEAPINTWEQANHGVDAAATYVTIIVQGKTDQAVTIDAPQVVVDTRQRPLAGPVAAMSGGGCGAQLQIRQFTVDLDQPQPVATFQSGLGLPSISAASGAVAQAQSPVFTVSDTDQEYFVVDATTRGSFVHWHLELTWQSMGQSGTYAVQNGSAPFATSAVNPADQDFYALRPDGSWSGPS